MPYIAKETRQHYESILEQLPLIEQKGILEFCIFKLMQLYRKHHVENYTELHNCCYATQHCADEFRRRFLDKREDAALLENGDI